MPGLVESMNDAERPLNVDFVSLAIKYPDFGNIYTSSEGHIDFQNPDLLKQLTKAILKVNFNLDISLPENRLCPPVPVRYEYIRWLQAILDTSNPTFTQSYDPLRKVTGIDIGVGASCIYPLLGCAARPQWTFGGVEIDNTNFLSASQNITLNGLQDRIKLHKNDFDSPLINLAGLDLDGADFVMCNPPFFTSKEDMAATFINKKHPPSAICTGADVEMITEGGDLGFVMRIFEESEKLREKIQWYSSMFGKLSSATKLITVLKEKGVTNYTVTCLQAGNVTKRWIVAWSYGDLRPDDKVARRHISTKNLLPFPNEFDLALPESPDLEAMTKRINMIMKELSVTWSWSEYENAGVCLARKDVWSRAARRKVQQQASCAIEYSQDEYGEVLEPKIKLGVRVALIVRAKPVVRIRWLQGTDKVLFESFCGMLKRKLVMDDKPAT